MSHAARTRSPSNSSRITLGNLTEGNSTIQLFPHYQVRLLKSSRCHGIFTCRDVEGGPNGGCVAPSLSHILVHARGDTSMDDANHDAPPCLPKRSEVDDGLLRNGDMLMEQGKVSEDNLDWLLERYLGYCTLRTITIDTCLDFDWQRRGPHGPERFSSRNVPRSSGLDYFFRRFRCDGRFRSRPLHRHPV